MSARSARAGLSVSPLGQEIRRRRRELGLTQDDVAAQVAAEQGGLTQQGLSALETGRTQECLGSTLAAVERVLQCDLRPFVAGSPRAA